MTEVNRRQGIRTALLGQLQASRGELITDFSSAVNLWISSFSDDQSPIKPEEQWMTSSRFNAQAERFVKAVKPFGTFTSIVTPTTLDVILRSNWGARSAATFSLASIINEHLSLVWVENRNVPSAGSVLRIRDAWIHKVRFETMQNLLRANCEWAARAVTVDVPPSALFELPTPPMGPVGSEVFGRVNWRVIRDPDVTDQEFSTRDLVLELDQGLIHRWDMTDDINVIKRGKTRVAIEFTTRVNDESWALVQQANAATFDNYRLIATTPSAEFRINLASVDFTYDPIGREAKDITRFRVRGEAFVSGTDVDIFLFD